MFGLLVFGGVVDGEPRESFCFLIGEPRECLCYGSDGGDKVFFFDSMGEIQFVLWNFSVCFLLLLLVSHLGSGWAERRDSNHLLLLYVLSFLPLVGPAIYSLFGPPLPVNQNIALRGLSLHRSVIP